MLREDHANRKSNQQNLGTIHCSNLCTEIIEYTSPDEEIFETIYFAACEASCDLAAEQGPYETYEGRAKEAVGGTHAPRGGEEPVVVTVETAWFRMKGLEAVEVAKIAQFGLRNSLLVAPMPTASTAQILGNPGGETDQGAMEDARNIHMVDATTAKLSSMHFHGWQLGLKTGLYYLRTKAAADAIKFTVDVEMLKKNSSDSDSGSSESRCC
eukprot:Skav215013  [mRNA]  locus=scaffold966:45413:52268:+ [translate_table: standard]